MSWVNAIMTNKGVALLSKLTQGNTLKITSAKTGAGTVSTSLLASQTNVTTLKQTLTIQSVGYPQEGKCALTVDLTNDDVTASYTVTQVGIFAQDPDEGEILFCITQADSGEGTTIPSATVMPGYNAQWTFYLQYGQADSVEVTVDPANAVTQAGMEQYVGTVVQSVERHISDGSVTTGGTGAAYTATVPGITALTAGKNFIMIPHVVSTTTTPTLDVNGLGAKGIRRRLSNISTSPQQGYSNSWLAVGKPFRVMYDGSFWIVEGMSKPSDSDTYGTKKAENVSFDNESTGMNAETVQAALEEVFTFASDGKKLLAETVTGLGVDTSEDDTWETISDNIQEAYLDTSDATVKASDLAQGVKAYGANRELVTGSLPVHCRNYGYIFTTRDATATFINDSTDGSYIKFESQPTVKVIIDTARPVVMGASVDKFGDAAASDVVSGKTFTSSAGLKKSGSVSETKSGSLNNYFADDVSGVTYNSVPYWAFDTTFTSDRLVRSGGKIRVSHAKENFGDATAADVVSGKKFTSSAGFNTTGTVSETKSGVTRGFVMDSQNSGSFSVGGASVDCWTLRLPVTGDVLFRSGSYIQARCPKSNFGDATAADVVNGKKFTSANGFNITGTAPKIETCAVTITSSVDITMVTYSRVYNGGISTLSKTSSVSDNFTIDDCVCGTVLAIKHKESQCKYTETGASVNMNVDGVIIFVIKPEEGESVEITLTPGS